MFRSALNAAGKRIAWLGPARARAASTESQSGIYYGHLGSNEDHHLSYHHDGKRHFKSGEIRYHEVADTPIAGQEGIRQLSHANVALSADWLNPRTEYPVSTREETLISLREELFVGCDSLLIDYYLADRASEEALRTMVARFAQERPLPALVDLRTVALDHDPDHLIGIALWAGRTRS